MQAGGNVTTLDSSGHITPALSPRTAQTAQASESALEFYTKFADPSQNEYSWSRALPDARKAFASGDLGLYIGHASEEELITSMNPNLNYAVAPIPQLRNSDYSIDTAYSYGFAISRQSANKLGAYTVAQTLSSTIPSQSLSIALGMPSARRDVLAMTTTADKDVVFNRSALASRYWVDPDPEKTDQVFQSMIEDTVSGAVHISDAVQRADQEIGHILGL
jgi:hypothetical protein